MSYVLAVFAFPLLLAVLSFGTGLVVQRVSGWSIPALLLAPLGFAGIIGLSQLVTRIGPIAPATPWVVLAVGLAGFYVEREHLRARLAARRPGWWWGPLAGVGAYLIAAAPVVLAFRTTFPAYLLDTTGAMQLMGAERLVTDGHDWSEPGSVYGTQLAGYFGTGYPSGSHSALGALGRLVPVDYIWLYAPYQAAMLGLTALVLTWIARRAGLPSWTAAIAGCIAAVPALVYAYLLQGAVKEIVLIPTLMLLGALVVLAREQFSNGPRAAVPIAVVGAAGWSTIGLSFTPWLALSLLAILVLGLPALPGGRSTWLRETAMRLVWFVPVLLLLALPTVLKLKTSINQATSVTDSNAAAVADPGNLLRPLLDVQVFGVWINASHRVDPNEFLRQTYLLIGVVVVAVALGLLWLVHRRRWEILAWIGTSLFVWVVLTERATDWTAAKLIVLFSPVVLLVAFLGAFGRLGSRRADGLLLGAAVAFGVLISDANLYHSTGLAPTQRFDELHDIGDRYAGRGPVLIPDFDEYALYLLRDMHPDGPGQARRVRPWSLDDGNGIGYGATVDVDQMPPRLVDDFGTIVVRRSAFKSRPPAAFRRLHHGTYYDVWQRDPAAPAPLLHESLGEGLAQAAAPACGAVRRFADAARAAGATTITAAPRRAAVTVDLRSAQGTELVAFNRDAPSASFIGPGTLTATVRVPQTGSYRLWLEGNVGRQLRALIDGRPAGAVRNESGGAGNALQYDAVELTPGIHTIELVSGGGSLRPGDADATTIGKVALEPVADEAAPVRELPLADWRALCGGSYDWLEAH